MLAFERYCAEIVAQADAMAGAVRGADLSTPVPTCPGWDVGQLVRHLGGGQRWAATIVRTQASEPPPDDHFRRVEGGGDPAVLGPWLAESARELADALREAGPDSAPWTPVAGRTSSFYARRFVLETVMHRADAVLALGGPFDLADDLAVDAVDEWMELGSLTQMLDFYPERRALLGPGRTVHLHATDTPADAKAEWVVDLTETLSWRRAHEKAAVAVRGPLTELLLVIYGRRSPADGTVEVLGDAEWLDRWLRASSFG